MIDCHADGQSINVCRENQADCLFLGALYAIMIAGNLIVIFTRTSCTFLRVGNVHMIPAKWSSGSQLSVVGSSCMPRVVSAGCGNLVAYLRSGTCIVQSSSLSYRIIAGYSFFGTPSFLHSLPDPDLFPNGPGPPWRKHA